MPVSRGVPYNALTMAPIDGCDVVPVHNVLAQSKYQQMPHSLLEAATSAVHVSLCSRTAAVLLPPFLACIINPIVPRKLA